jgi:hypothetical protein
MIAIGVLPRKLGASCVEIGTCQNPEGRREDLMKRAIARLPP